MLPTLQAWGIFTRNFLGEKLKFNILGSLTQNKIGFLSTLTLKLPDKLQPYGLYVYYVVHICNFCMVRVKSNYHSRWGAEVPLKNSKSHEFQGNCPLYPYQDVAHGPPATGWNVCFAQNLLKMWIVQDFLNLPVASAWVNLLIEIYILIEILIEIYIIILETKCILVGLV